MASNKRKKFKKIVFKLSKSEYDYLIRCATLEKTTANKLIKKYLRTGFESMRERVEDWQKQKQPENQLDLFAWDHEDEESSESQKSMLAEEKFLYEKK